LGERLLAGFGDFLIAQIKEVADSYLTLLQAFAFECRLGSFARLRLASGQAVLTVVLSEQNSAAIVETESVDLPDLNSIRQGGRNPSKSSHP
jgi:hypothetical protein